ncbi:hypothetical protein KSP40_PGU008785 [Platanthera guangdongensis]|uniref:Maturase K n=1 Tax=Platanthera guangdongensis TaxID=2320717 RepID=A0ABR2LHB7_9ASPA
MEDLLRQGWLMDSHLDVFAGLLNSRRSKSSKLWKKFIYVSSTYVIRFIHIIVHTCKFSY